MNKEIKAVLELGFASSIFRECDNEWRSWGHYMMRPYPKDKKGFFERRIAEKLEAGPTPEPRSVAEIRAEHEKKDFKKRPVRGPWGGKI